MEQSEEVISTKNTQEQVQLSEEALRTEHAESVTSETSLTASTSSHKMKIDELTSEDVEHAMEVDSTVASKPNKVSNISSFINETSPSQPENANEASGNVQTQAIAPTATPVSTSSNVSSTATGSTTQSMQLNDAFAYLDRVRAEFADQPEIYNKFLQVMREFKSNSIDANGVIVRVVQLFKGHRNLILGFNAFLPKTHHIDPNIQDFSRWAQNLPGASNHSEQISPTVVSSGPYPTVIPSSAQQQPPQQHQQPPQQQQYGRPGQGYQSVQPSPYTTVNNVPTMASGGAGAPSIPAVGPSPALVRGQNVQFNRAVSFVEKIKTRFANQPETYRSFLSLLHSFHRDQRGIKEVYQQVQQLFRNEPDLLEEFSLFLPDNSTSSSAATSASAAASRGIPNSMLPPVGRFPSSNSPSTAAASRQGPPAPGGNKRTTQASQSSIPEKAKRSRAHEVYNVTKSNDETEFFEKVKKYLGSRQVYADFLKCLSLFSQDILKLHDLINMVHGFIGGNDELFSWFKRYINFKDSDMKLLDSSSGPSATSSRSNRNAGSFAEAQVPELNLSALKRVGCYRIYPRGYRLCKASGRTVLCDEVLNDELVSCAVFESEDSGFLSSKKNQYEDALFKCEDERFEMDLILEYNLSTIAVLEPIAKRIEKMTAEERENFRLDHRLNGTSEIIYKKAIKRIYGDKADDIYEYLQKSPCASVPVVLKRLKAKDEEWRRVQRDWNRVWAEIHIKNYYKALDHQGIDFKASDRKTLTVRSLVNEIQVIKEERKRIQERSGPKIAPLTSPHMSQMMTDSSLLKDMLNLIEVTIRSSANFSGVDRKSLTRFFSTFVPEFFRIEIDSEAGGSGNKVESETEVARAKSSISGNLLLYANDSLFAFVRIFMIAYERLEKLKQSALASQNRPFFTEKTNVVAQFLDLHSRQSTMTVDEELATGRDFYGVLMYLLEQLIEGEIEPGLFEEKVRYMFGTSGYLIFTYDKVLLSLLRQTLTVLNDASCENLIRLYDSWRSRRGPRTSEYSARLAAENIVNDSPQIQGGSSTISNNLYRIELNLLKRQLTIHLVDRLSQSGLGGGNNSSGGSIEEKWSNYVDNFVKLESNPQYLNSKSRPFLSRTRHQVEAADSSSEPLKDISILYNLECKICINTYKIFYVENTEDVLVKRFRKSITNGGSKGKRGLLEKALKGPSCVHCALCALHILLEMWSLIWLTGKLIFLYLTALLMSISFYFYLQGKVLPPHRTLRFPVEWRDEVALVDFGVGQRVGGDFRLMTREGKNDDVRNRNFGGNVIDFNVPYDLTLLLKYPDRPEVADLGNLKIVTKLARRDGRSVGKFQEIRALRYESTALRLMRDFLWVPGALWKDSGSDRTERIVLFNRFIDDDNNNHHRQNNNNNNNRKTESKSHAFTDENVKIPSNPIEKIEISINPLPPLHSLQLEVLVNLSPLQHFLFYYRIPAAILIIGTGTTILWIFITIYGLVELMKILLFLSKGNSRQVVELDEVAEFNEIEEIEVEQGEGSGSGSDTLESEESTTVFVESVEFPPAESVANFIGDLRQRQWKKNDSKEEEDEEDDLIEINEDENDQSVPEFKKE